MSEKTGDKPETNGSYTAKGATGKLWGFGVATLVWLAIAISLGWYADDTVKLSCTFRCLTANEWGDFLAGVFAPIAFLWLVATVWIQSDELREQREELRTTRSVMREQAEEARKQAIFIGTQTSILQQTQADEQFRAFLSVFQSWVRHNFEKHGMKLTVEGVTPSGDVGYLTESSPSDPVEFFIQLSGRLQSALEDLTTRSGNREWRYFTKSTGTLRNQLPMYLLKISEFYPQVSPAMQLVIISTSIKGIAEELDKHPEKI